MKVLKNKWLWIFGGISLCLAIYIFKTIIDKSISTDIQTHTRHLLACVDQRIVPTPPLYFTMLFILGGFSFNIALLNQIAIYLLSVFVCLKFFTTYYVVSDRLEAQSEQSSFKLLLGVVILCLLFVAPIYYELGGRMYLGRLGINVWHNSTTIVAMPFVILLFRESLKFIENEHISKRNIIYIFLLAFIQILIKPSFLFAYAPTFPLMLLFKDGIRHPKFWWSVGIVASICVFIFVEYYVIYQLDTFGKVYKQSKSGLEIKPFKVWSHYSKNIWLDATVSIFFPLIFTLLTIKDLKHNTSLQFAIVLFIFAILVAILIVERGNRALHGNLFWQVIMTNYLLFLVCIISVFKKMKKWARWNVKSILLTVAFMCHTISGVLYVHKILIARSYF
jgi:hypothetical protein